MARPPWLGSASPAPRVDAASTVFYSQPAGDQNLVRFSVTGLEAPAGRLRVYDESRRLLGTAGVLRRDDALYGELWLPLLGPSRVVSELEAPGVRGPWRTRHRLEPHRKWVIHLLSVVEPRSAFEELNGLPLFRRIAQTALYRSQRIGANPLPSLSGMAHLDHLPLLRAVAKHTDDAQRLGVPVATTAVSEESLRLSSSLVQTLIGSGVRTAYLPGEPEPFQWLEGRDGSQLLVISMPPGATPEALGFRLAADIMAARLEHWLSTSPQFLSPVYDRSVAVVISSGTGLAAESVHRAVSEWNLRYAFPAIVPADSEALIATLETTRGGVIPTVFPRQANSLEIPQPSTIRGWASELRDQDARRSREIVAVLAQLIEPGSEDLAVIASEVSALVDGTVVFNPSPFSRSEFVRLSDGSERVVTDIPGLGYAYFPNSREGEAASWIEHDKGKEIEGRELRARVDPETGALESLIGLSDGIELIRPGSAGLNAVDASRVERISSSQLPGVATRLTVKRWSPGRGTVNTTITAYNRLPWLDIENDAEAVGDSPSRFKFHFDVASPAVSWEVPGGYEEAEAPIGRLDHLRWLRLALPRGAILMRAIDAPSASVDADGTVISHGSRGVNRYRIARESEFDSPDLAWQFGWGTAPMLCSATDHINGGRLPTFGAVFDVGRVGVAVLGILPARDGVVVYLQELLGVRRHVTIRPGLVGFGTAQPVDLLERPIGEPLIPQNGSVAVPVAGHGVTAVRLSELELNRS